MTATANITEVFCDGPGGDWPGCPTREYMSSAHYTADDLRAQLAEQGWQTVVRFDLPPIDRCPACGLGTC